MQSKTLLLTIATLASTVGSAACTVDTREPMPNESTGRTELDPPQGLGKADGASSCAGNCGTQAPAGCWCDAGCAQYGDCCPDQSSVCGDGAGGASPGGPQPCSGVCTYGAKCSDYCPPTASCIQVVDDGPSYWQVLGCGR